MKGNFKKYLTLIVLGAAGGAIYTLPYIRGGFLSDNVSPK